MRINKLLISLSVIAIAMTACVKEDHSLTQEQSKVTLDVNFDETNLICNMDDLNEEETRTTVGDETGVTYLYWGYRESVGVYGSTTKNSRFRTSNVTPSRTAQITGTMSYGDTPRYAYYPYNSANTQNAYTAVASHLPINQTFDTEERELTFDFKVAPVSSSGGTNFTTLMTYLRLVVNATGTQLQGDKLESISFIAPEGRSFGGDFTVNLATQRLTWGEAPEGANVVTVTCPNNPVLGRNVTEVIYITCAPGAIKAGDDYQIVIRTDKHIATIDKTLSKTLAGKTTYKNTLTLSSQKMTVSSRVAMTEFSFKVADNEAKILGTDVYYDGAKTTTCQIDGKDFDVDENTRTVSGVIPYLYDFNLVPTFTTTAGAKVYHNGEQVVSGETSIDFSQPVEFVVKAGVDEVTYTVDIRNSGLPVVVLSQNGREGTVLWSGAGIKVNDKPAEFDDIMTSSIAVYNADGTVDLEEATCAFRLRGNSSYGFPKKPFAIKLNSAANILGIMPEGGSHKRWVLLANYIDRSLMRNAIINKLANLSIDAWKNTEGAEPGLVWNPSGQSVELVIDGRHVGNYYLTEQVKIDEHRLNINEPWDDKTNTAFAESGYLLELDDAYDEKDNGQFITKRYIPVLFKDETPQSYCNDIRDKFLAMEENLKKGAESRSVTESDAAFAAAFEDIDLASWIDNWLLHEIAMNAEYKHPKSVYMYMNGDSKIFGGPVWDFDYQTFPNVSGVNAINNMYKSKNPPAYNFTTSKWLCEVGVNAKWSNSLPSQSSQPYSSETGNVDTPYLWFPWLLESDAFKAKVKERWEIIKPYWLDIYAYITMFGEANAISQEFNNAMWPIMSNERLAHSWYIEYSGDEDIETWEGVIDNFRTVFTERFNAMDTMIQAFPSAETN